MKKLAGYIAVLFVYLRKYYLQAKHPGLTFAGKPLIGKRVKIGVERGGRITFQGDITLRDDVIIQVRKGAEIVVGHRSYFNRGCSVIIHNGLVMGEEVMLGENVKIYDNDHAIQNGKVMRRAYETAPISIKDRCWIANNAVVLKGTNMGPDTVVAALSLASGNLDASALYMGVPCRKLKKLEEKANG